MQNLYIKEDSELTAEYIQAGILTIEEAEKLAEMGYIDAELVAEELSNSQKIANATAHYNGKRNDIRSMVAQQQLKDYRNGISSFDDWKHKKLNIELDYSNQFKTGKTVFGKKDFDPRRNRLINVVKTDDSELIK